MQIDSDVTQLSDELDRVTELVRSTPPTTELGSELMFAALRLFRALLQLTTSSPGEAARMEEVDRGQG